MVLRRPNGVPHPALRPGLRVDRVGTEAVVLDGRAGVVHRLTGEAAEVLTELVMRGRDVGDLPARLADAVAGLREVGVLRPGIGRRRVLGTATVGTLGIMSLALPSALVAASPGSTRVRGTATDASGEDGVLGLPAGAGASTGFTYRTYASAGTVENFTVGGSGYLVVDVLAVGAGGAGAGPYGGGGGGGAVSLLLEQSLDAGDTLQVIVGAGGDASTTSGGGDSGMYDVVASSFAVLAQGGAGGVAAGVSEKGAPGVGGQSYAGVPSPGGSPGGNGGVGGGSFDGGGGAGAGGAGGDSPSSMAGGDGGPAFALTGFFASAYAVAGGGGGAGYSGGGTAGTGGGNGGRNGGAAQNATGPGGGGGGAYSGSPGTGGDGLVVVRYLT